MNGDIAKKIAELRSKEKLDIDEAQLLTLEILGELYSKFDQFFERRFLPLEKTVEDLRRKSVVIWVESHPKLTLFFIALFLLLFAAVDEYQVIAKALELAH